MMYASPSRSVSASASRSASRRVLTNTSVVACVSISSARRSYISAAWSADATASSGEAGISSAISHCRTWPVSTTRQGRGAPPSSTPVRKPATSSTGRCVADSPIRCARPGRSQGPSRCADSASRRASVKARCAPRLLPTTAWISSMMTVATPLSSARPLSLVSRIYRDSGVVTRICGGRRRMAARAACGVSPVRTAVRMPGLARPCSSSNPPIAASGASRLRWISLLSAFSGDT